MMHRMKYFPSFMVAVLLAVFVLSAVRKVQAQTVYHHIHKTSVYEYLDELAGLQIIELNSAVKPYSRKLIAEKLAEAKRQKEKLNPRQREELAFFLKDFNKELHSGEDFTRRFDLLYHQDSLFTFTMNVIGGLHYFPS